MVLAIKMEWQFVICEISVDPCAYISWHIWTHSGHQIPVILQQLVKHLTTCMKALGASRGSESPPLTQSMTKR